MVGMGLGLGLGLGSTPSPPPAQPIDRNGGPEFLLQAEILSVGDKTREGALVQAVSLPWLEIVEHLNRHPDFLFSFVQNPRKFEEFIAACYDKAGFDEVTLTPQRGDGGRDVIVVKKGFGSIRFLEQVKAYSPGHLVTHDDVRAMVGTLSMDGNASKGLITTTSQFQPGITKPDSEFAKLMPHRLELKDKVTTLEWIESIRAAQGS